MVLFICVYFVDNAKSFLRFRKVFGADRVGGKQFKKSMKNILTEIKATPEECIMVGDTKSTDIACANFVGMKAILYDYNDMRDLENIELNNYIVIKNLDELLKLL